MTSHIRPSRLRRLDVLVGFLTGLLSASILAAFAQQSSSVYSSQDYGTNRHFRRERVSWCTTSLLERRKCLDWARAIEEANVQLEGQEPFKLNLDCAQGADRDQCMAMIDDERADMILLDPGELGVAGRYHSLTPIMTERYGQSRSESGHYSVAVVRKRSSLHIQSLADLFGKRACFSGVSHMASWTLPLASLIDLPRFEIADCNNLVKSASYFFGNSCAPNALINKFNPTGDNPQKMSLLCDQQNSRVGAQSEPYSGAFSALKCLTEAPRTSSAGADVAFLPHNTVMLAEKLNLGREFRAELPSRSDLELLCPQGGRAPIERWASCNFGFVPAHAIVVSSRTTTERRESIQKFLKTSVQLMSGPDRVGASSGSFKEIESVGGSSNQGQFDRSNQFQQQFSTNYQDPNRFTEPLANQFSGLGGRPVGQSPVNNLGDPYGSFGQQTGNVDKTPINGINSFKLTGEHSFLNYPSLDVLFSSDMSDLVPLSGIGQTFKGYLNSFMVQPATSGMTQSRPISSGSEFYGGYLPAKPVVDNSIFDVNTQTDYFEKLRRCSVPAVVLCVTSERELNKCLAMSKAFHAATLRPELNCKLAQSTLACMQLIKNRDADLVVLDPADVYMAGSRFAMIPIAAEQVEMYESGNYAVAVAKKSDQTTDLFSLKGKMSCHSGFLKGAGWVMPMAFLIGNDKVRRYEPCDSAKSAAEHFDKSCVPGVLSSVSNIQNISSWTVRNMCELCHGTGASYCARDASEPFFGDTGSFRCLVEGGGQVAFTKHTALFENTGGSNRETWARNLIKSDFELLCRDGSRAPVTDYKSCNLGSVPANTIMTRGDTPLRLIDAYVNLFMYGQQYYGSKYTEEYTFKMFSSPNKGHDLIFQDATQQLVRVPLVNQTYSSYLGHDFLHAMKIVFDCN